jgi:hypothetical protein
MRWKCSTPAVCVDVHFYMMMGRCVLAWLGVLACCRPVVCVDVCVVIM